MPEGQTTLCLSIVGSVRTGVAFLGIKPFLPFLCFPRRPVRSPIIHLVLHFPALWSPAFLPLARKTRRVQGLCAVCGVTWLFHQVCVIVRARVAPGGRPGPRALGITAAKSPCSPNLNLVLPRRGLACGLFSAGCACCCAKQPICGVQDPSFL